MRPITSHAASAPVTPPWLEFQPREGFELCPCAAHLVQRWCARSSCPICNGGGIVRPRAILAAPELGAAAHCAEAG